MTKLFVIKIGGNIIDDEKKLSSFLRSFAAIDEKKILVHGGGKLATKWRENGIKIVEGRVTDAKRRRDDGVCWLWQKILQLQSLNCNAIGVTGADGNLIPASKRR
jgi:acetylglutamate kinase